MQVRTVLISRPVGRREDAFACADADRDWAGNRLAVLWRQDDWNTAGSGLRHGDTRKKKPANERGSVLHMCPFQQAVEHGCQCF